MGCIQYGLCGSFKTLEPYLVQHQRKNNWNWETPQQAIKTKQYRILQHPYARWRREETRKPFQANPLAPKHSPACLIIPEGNLYAIHRKVLVDNGQHDGD